ncbi:trans-aconitate 2-methyltransferase [Streptomyces sp. NPDC092296]|uniref:trans-aconitate 2-methyltransferase n=1 Tax=Streptomyces sp. NPDC092296 TaxID=3366012 RepID=UPI0037F31DA4
MSDTRWDPAQYLRYQDERTRPLIDLLARIPAGLRPRRILDLGCGPGNSTAPLRHRWPDAHITGLDNSPRMLAEARAAHAGPNPGGTGSTDYAEADARDYDPAPEQPDLIVSNALLQWVPDHIDVLDDWLRALRPGGVLAFQVPGNFDAPSHTLLAELRTSPRWHDLVGTGARRDAAVHQPGDYLALLAAHGCTADVWETTYHQLLPGTDPVLEWVKGTALRPVLSVLGPEDRDLFLRQYRDLLRRAYPTGPYGTVFPFRRIFAVARRPA